MKPNQISLILSLLFPAGVLWGLYEYLNGSEAHNVALPPAIEAIDSRLDTTQPDIILVGSSLANKSVNEEVMAQELGLAPSKVQKIWSGMAAMPAIRLMIENRILAQNLQPKVVAILSPPVWLTTTDVLQDANFSTHQTRH